LSAIGFRHITSSKYAEDITHTGASLVLVFAFAGQAGDLTEIFLRQTGPPGVIDQQSIKPLDHKHFVPPEGGDPTARYRQSKLAGELGAQPFVLYRRRKIRAHSPDL